METIWPQIYVQIHEHLRDALKRRDQIIAFYLVLLAALISAWEKLGEIQILIATGAWVLGIGCFIVLTQYWRWQLVLHMSIVTLQVLMVANNQTLDECKRIWNQVNETNTTVWKFLNPFRGVETNIIYLFATMTFIPFYLVFRSLGVAFIHLKTEIVVFLLDGILYTFFMGFLASLFIKKFSNFDERHWMYRWLPNLPDNDGDSHLHQENK